MARAPIAIDLGELPRDERPDSDTPWPGWWRRLGRTRSGVGRWLPAAGAAALLLLTTAAAAAPARPWAVPLFTVPAGDWVGFGPEHLYVTRQPETELASLTVYRLTDGEPVWEADGLEPDGSLIVQYGLPLYVSYRTDAVETGDELYSYTVLTTTVFDPATGEPRWTHEGDPAIWNDEVMLFQQQTQEPPTRFALEAVDVATGRSRWTLPPAQQWGYNLEPNQAQQLVSLTQDAGDWRLTSYDLKTGDRLATNTLDLPEGPDNLFVVGSRVLLQSVERPTLRTYDLATLDHQWTAAVRADSRFVTGCGEVLCVFGELLYALDPATGELAWSADWLPPDRAGTDLITALAWSWDHLLMDGRVIDATSGEPVLELAEWEPLLANGVRSGEPERLLIRHTTLDDPGVWRTWFGRIRTDPTRLETLGALDGRQQDCQPVAGYLACREGSDLHVWRIHPASTG